MVLTDTHTHLYAAEFDADRERVIERAIEQGITRLFLPNVDNTSVESMLALVKRYPGHCFPMMGLHPCSVNADVEKELGLVHGLLQKGKFYAVGEIGLDFYWDMTFAGQQVQAFTRQVEWAKTMNLPVAIHTRTNFKQTTRNAFEEVVVILQSLRARNLKGVFHCFSGNVEDAQKIIDLGFYLGIGGTATFKKSGLDKVIEQIDLSHIVLETDSPYITPEPFRGKRNESGYLIYIARKIADIKKISVEEVAAATTANSKKLFAI